MMNSAIRRPCLLVLLTALVCVFSTQAWAFSTQSTSAKTTPRIQNSPLFATSVNLDDNASTNQISRRSVFQKAITATASMAAVLAQTPAPAFAADKNANNNDQLDSYLYKIIRVREATQQERRLIKSGKFKDMQRANVKLAVKFMVSNYRLADCVVGASAYLKGGNAAQMRAIDVGQTAVQNLQTILEYFDTSDVENIKVCVAVCGEVV